MTTQTTDGILLSLSNPEMERAFINSLIVYPERLKLADIQPDDLHDYRNRLIFEAIREMDARNVAIEIETIIDHMTGHKTLESAGGFAYLAGDIQAHTMGFGQPDDYAPALVELATRRRAFREAQDMARAVIDRSRPVNDTINDFSVRLPKLVRVRGGAQHVSVFASNHYDRMRSAVDDPEEAQRRILKTDMLDFDEITGGLHMGELIIMYGKPGLGKTKWVHQLGAQLAKNQYPGVIFQCETAEEEIMDREFSRETKIPTERLETATLLEEEWPLYTHAFEKMVSEDYPLYLDFSGRWNTVTLRAELTRMKAERGIRWFVLDYLKFLTDNYGKDETERENFISIQLKRICRDLEIAGITIHSMNKAGMTADVPDLEHGSGGAGISYDCDKALFMVEHTPESGPVYPNYRTFIFRKSRRKIKRKMFHMIAFEDNPGFGDPTKRTSP